MNSLYNTALKQSTSLRHDLSKSTDLQLPLHPSHLGQLSASLTSFSRTIESYSNLQKSELNPGKKEKAAERLATFRSELQDYKSQFAALRERNESVQLNADRGELLGRRPHGTGGGGTPDNPYRNVTSTSGAMGGQLGGNAAGGGVAGIGLGSGDAARENHAFREQNFFANTHIALDEYLARGQAVLGDLSQQREVLKGTQRKLYNVANTLGISGDTIRMVERRARQDKWIFGVGVIIFFGFCWLCLKYLR